MSPQCLQRRRVFIADLRGFPLCVRDAREDDAVSHTARLFPLRFGHFCNIMLSDGRFSVIQIFVPIFAFVIVILCCVSLCKTLQRVFREHLESQSQTQTLSIPERPSIFIIPFSPPDEQLHGPPRYSTVDHCSRPPAYHELELKPDFIPCDSPPAYSDSTSYTLHEFSESSPADTISSAGD
ncbi:hypothetical protein AOLI_G00172360 [Acnodon oligacanthus]